MPAQDRKESESGVSPPDREFLEDWLLRTCELVDKYQPQVVWFDWWIAQPVFHPYLQKFAAYYYNRGAEWQKGVAINYKKHGGESFPDTAGVLDIERANWPTCASCSGRPIPRSPRTPGLHPEPRLQDGRLDCRTTWWTSSPRTAACC